MVTILGVNLGSSSTTVLLLGLDAAQAVSLTRTFVAAGERRFLQHSESPRLRKPDQLPELAPIWRSHTDPEQLTRRRRPERRTESLVPDWRPAFDTVGTEAICPPLAARQFWRVRRAAGYEASCSRSETISVGTVGNDFCPASELPAGPSVIGDGPTPGRKSQSGFPMEFVAQVESDVAGRYWTLWITRMTTRSFSAGSISKVYPVT